MHLIAAGLGLVGTGLVSSGVVFGGCFLLVVSMGMYLREVHCELWGQGDGVALGEHDGPLRSPAQRRASERARSRLRTPRPLP